MKETHVSRNGTENRAEQKGPTIRSQTEVTGLAQEEETGNTQEPLNPRVPGSSGQVQDTSTYS